MIVIRAALFFILMSAFGSVAVGQELVWKQMTEIPRAVAGYMAGVSHGTLVVAGGSYWEGGEKRWADLVQVFDPRANTWRSETPLPSPRSDAASATLDNDIYIFGGGTGNDARTDALVLHEGAWSVVPEAALPAPRVYATAISSGKYIYLLGGLARAGDYHSPTTTFWRWRPKARAWEVLPPLPGPGRINHAMTTIDGKVYVFGGATTGPQDVENLKDAYEYDPDNRTWTRLPDLSVANRAWWAVSLGHCALLLGGYTDDFAAQVYRYDQQHKLQPVSPLPHGLADIKFFRIGNVVIGSGGEAGDKIRGKWTFEAELPKSWLGWTKE